MWELINKLDKKGFIVQYYEAITTNSCYLKLDYGVCGSIRIGDHRGKKKYKFKFNLCLDLDKSYIADGRYYFSVADIDNLIDMIEISKTNAQNKYGFKYFEYMVENKAKIGKEIGFWSSSKVYND